MSFPDFWQSVRTTFRIGLPLAAVLTCTLLALSFFPPLTRPLSIIEQSLIDYRMAQAWDRLPAEYPSIVIVTISEDDLVDYKDWIVTPRDLLARVVAAVDEMSPRAIGLDYYFVSAQTPERDEQLLTALRQAKAAMVIGAVQNPDVFTQRQLEFQKSFVAASGRQAGFLSVARDAGP